MNRRDEIESEWVVGNRDSRWFLSNPCKVAITRLLLLSSGRNVVLSNLLYEAAIKSKSCPRASNLLFLKGRPPNPPLLAMIFLYILYMCNSKQRERERSWNETRKFQKPNVLRCGIMNLETFTTLQTTPVAGFHYQQQILVHTWGWAPLTLYKVPSAMVAHLKKPFLFHIHRPLNHRFLQLWPFLILAFLLPPPKMIQTRVTKIVSSRS